jgi:hypothetical protein
MAQVLIEHTRLIILVYISLPQQLNIQIKLSRFLVARKKVLYDLQAQKTAGSRHGFIHIKPHFFHSSSSLNNLCQRLGRHYASPAEVTAPGY